MALERLAGDEGVEQVVVLEVAQGLLGAEQETAAKEVGGGNVAAGQAEQVELTGPVTEHGLQADEEGGLAAAGRAIEPDGGFVAGFEGEGQAGKFLEEAGGGGNSAGEKGAPGGRLGGRVVGDGKRTGQVVAPLVRGQLAGGEVEDAVLAGEEVGILVPAEDGPGEPQAKMIEEAGEDAG